jgi:hypothetical protein
MHGDANERGGRQYQYRHCRPDLRRGWFNHFSILGFLLHSFMALLPIAADLIWHFP